MRIIHVINDLVTGGAEMTLLKLARGLRPWAWQRVVVLKDEGSVGRDLVRAGVGVHPMEVSGLLGEARAIYGLTRWLERRPPDLVVTWMPQSNLIGGIAARRAGCPVVWNLKQVGDDPDLVPRPRTASRAAARLSRRVPARIVCASEASYARALAEGYAADRLVRIPNGFDTDVFRPDDEARASLRGILGIDQDALVVGMAATHKRHKDWDTVLAALRRVAREQPRAAFVLCGPGVDEHSDVLRAALVGKDLEGRLHLLGQREDMPRVYAALDVLVWASKATGGFPNVVAEAMASGVPAVVTQVGDAAGIVDDTGVVVPPGAPDELGAAILELLALPANERRELGRRARARVQQTLSLESMLAAYRRLYEEVVHESRGERDRAFL